MNKKIISIFCVTLFILIAVPNFQAQETTETSLFNYMAGAHVNIKGSGTTFILAGSFILGIGRCSFMRLKLEEDAHVEINKFLNSSDVIILDGSHTVTLFGYYGYYRDVNEINLNGLAYLAFWK